MKQHLWQGEWIDHGVLLARVSDLDPFLKKGYEVAFDIEEFYQASGRFSQRLLNDLGLRKKMIELLVTGGEANASDAMLIVDEIADFLSEASFRRKVRAEFGTDDPLRSQRISYLSNTFESWFPLGFVVQILASNSPSLPVLSAFEGLVTGNINFIKVSSSSSDFTAKLFEEFFCDPLAKNWCNLLIVAKFSSREKQLLQNVMKEADAVVAWGGEEALAEIRLMTPARARLIEWGHRISFLYLSQNQFENDEVFGKIAHDVFRFDQQACSSPQCLFLEGADFSRLQDFSQQLAKAFQAEAIKNTCSIPDDFEAGELSRVTLVNKIESSLQKDLTDVVEDPEGKWRIFVDTRPGLRASPLFRTLWLKPIRREQILSVFRPLGQYLQTVGLMCDRDEIHDISRRLYQAGVTRVREVGEMLESYAGEPHDGFPALARYMKKVSLEQGSVLDGFATVDDLVKSELKFAYWPSTTMGKEEFQSQSSLLEKADLYFKSGGSSGEPKLSLFTYDDYHRQMRLAADGLLAAGLEPAKDRCMNLFFGGGLYGGFLSFFTILEDLRAVQFPMSAHLDLKFVGEMIVKNKVNVLLAMPSYLGLLFEENKKLFKKHRVINKIFFGGEHLSQGLRDILQNEFGIQHIVSASYGSVDMGPLGYQCRHCPTAVHHLHQHLHFLEILALDSDRPVAKGEIGRLVFSTHGRHGQNLLRYDIGDLGMWLEGECECGRKSPRFKLMGRHGDIFRAADAFFNYNKFNLILNDYFNYSNNLQIRIDNESGKDRLRLYIEHSFVGDVNDLRKFLLAKYSELQELVEVERSLLFEILKIDNQQFEYTAGSGKLRRVLDKRKK